MRGKIVLIENEIQDILGSSASSLLSSSKNHRLSVLKEELKKLSEYELNSAKLQSRMTWASLGDSITKFFPLGCISSQESKCHLGSTA